MTLQLKCKFISQFRIKLVRIARKKLHFKFLLFFGFLTGLHTKLLNVTRKHWDIRDTVVMMKWKLTIASALWKVKVCDTSALEWVLPAAPSCLWWDLLEHAERWSRRRTLPALNTQTHDTRELTIGTHNSTAGYTLQRVSPSLRRIRLHSSLLRSNSVGQTTGMLPANGFSCWIINYTHIQTLQITLYIIQHITGIVHPKIKMCSPSDHPRLGWVCLFIRFVEMCLCITVSAMDALQWMGAVRMRVQTADKNITIIHK